MGILKQNGWDVFYSYSRLDNEQYHGWIKNFSDDLKVRVQILLKVKGYDFDLDQLAFFFDTEGMPANGSLKDELIGNIKASHFLFLFVGENYLKSDWCGKELDSFSERFSGLQDMALKNIFMIMLTPAAVRDANANKGNLIKIKSNGIFQLAYNPPDEDEPVRAQLRDARNILGANPDYETLVDKLATTLTSRFIEAGLGIKPPPPPADPVIAFGVVNPRLKDYRSRLATSVAQRLNMKIDVWEWEDLSRGPEELSKRLDNARMFIQLIDRSPVGLASDSQPGGFLAAQKELVPAKVPLLWIEPTDAGTPDQEERSPVHAAFLNAILGGALKLPADKSVEEVAERLQPSDRPKFAKIMIEHSDEDQEEVFRVHKVINDAWCDVSDPGLPLRFSAAEWTEMKNAPDKFQTCHGIVVVDRSRPYATLEAQLGDIEDELAKRNQELAYRTFVLPPKSKATILTWERIRFQEATTDGLIEVITEEALKKFLVSVKEKALSVNTGR